MLDPVDNLRIINAITPAITITRIKKTKQINVYLINSDTGNSKRTTNIHKAAAHAVKVVYELRRLIERLLILSFTIYI